jgi:hypothetical protein
MIVDGFEYRYAYTHNPPTPLGVGVEDPDCQYWITPGDIYCRPHTEEEGWRKAGSDHPLHSLRMYLYTIPPLPPFPGGTDRWSCRFGKDTAPNALCDLCRERGGWEECVYSILPE